MNALNALLDKVRGLLAGEPARAIAYGAVVVVWLVTHAAFALGIVHSQPPAFDVILAAVTGAIALLTEGIRMFVVSPATVAVVQAGAAAAAVASVAAGAPATIATVTAPAIATTTSVTPAPDDPTPAAPDPDPASGDNG